MVGGARSADGSAGPLHSLWYVGKKTCFCRPLLLSNLKCGLGFLFKWFWEDHFKQKMFIMTYMPHVFCVGIMFPQRSHCFQPSGTPETALNSGGLDLQKT